MTHKVLRFQDSLYNRPQLVLPSTFDSVLDYLNDRNSSNAFELSASKTSFTEGKALDYDATTKTGTLSISGPLTYKASILSALCGVSSYQTLQADFNRLVAIGAKTIVLWVDSGGGEAFGMQETAEYIRTQADKHGIRLIQYCDGIAASAAYGLSCVAHEVILNPYSQAGSVGCVVKLRNNNKQLKNAGIEETLLYAGKNKVAFDKSGEWSSDFLSDIQSRLDNLYTQFTTFVAKYRKLDVKAVVATQAKMFSAKDAVDLGLADAVMTRQEFADYLRTGKASVATAKPVTSASVTPTPKASTSDGNGVRKYLEQQYVKPIQDAKLKAGRLQRINKSFTGLAAINIYESTKNLSDRDFEDKLIQMERYK